MMDHSKWVSEAPLVIAHRGASAYAPENTLAAFRMAETLGADAIELDAKLLQDGTIIVLHDNSLDRTTNGRGAIYQYKHIDLQQLDAGSHFSIKFAQERIPTLDEVFQNVGSNLLINVEMTNYARPRDRLPQKVIALIHEYGLDNRILLSSFNPWALIVAKKLDPSIPRALLVGSGEPKIVRFILKAIMEYLFYHPQETLVNEEEIKKLKRKGKRVNAWTVNTSERMRELYSMNVDGVITDFPDVARQILERSQDKDDSLVDKDIE
jgi:glycerophosphoryl diester phosphodiesterase